MTVVDSSSSVYISVWSFSSKNRKSISSERVDCSWFVKSFSNFKWFSLYLRVVNEAGLYNFKNKFLHFCRPKRYTPLIKFLS